jgi:hypothetical protein
MTQLPQRIGSALALFMRPALWQAQIKHYGVDPSYRRLARMNQLTGHLLDPIRRYERWRYETAIGSTPITAPPVFILGFWRTGTTYLHEVMACDPQFAYPDHIQMFAPEAYLTAGGVINRLLRLVAPETRVVDHMPLDFDRPQEDEVGLMNLTPYALYHWWLFPQSCRELVTRYVLFEGISDAELDGWRQSYRHLLQKLTFASQGRQLILKNPPNTGRIRQLLALFPDAKFIHIYRDPVQVIPSFIQMHTMSFHMNQLQAVTPGQIRESTLDTFERVMQRYLADRDLIAPDRLIEVRYEEFVGDPLRHLRRIYDHLCLGDYDAVEARFKQDIAGRASFQPTQRTIPPDLIAEVRERCAFAIREWNY